MFTLRDIRPVAKGKSRLVFAHPTDPNLIIKVMKPEHFEEDRQDTGWKKWIRPAHPFRMFAKEVHEQLVLIGEGEKIDKYLARIHGFCETDFGLGILVQAMRGPNGKLAPTLARLIRKGRFTPTVRNDLDDFCNRLLVSDINCGRLMIQNVLYAIDESGTQRFVLVDGYGSSACFSFKRAYPELDRRLFKSHRLERFKKSVVGLVKGYDER